MAGTMLGNMEPYIYFEKFNITANSNVIPSLADFGVNRKLIDKCARGEDPTGKILCANGISVVRYDSICSSP